MKEEKVEGGFNCPGRKAGKSKEEEEVDECVVATFLTITPGKANECSNYTWHLLWGRKEFSGVPNSDRALV